MNQIQLLRKLGGLIVVPAILLFASFVFLKPSVFARESAKKPSVTEKIFKRGETLYQKQCSVCHGALGAADGKAAYLLYPKPRDFTRDKFRLVSTKDMQATDEDLFQTIGRGMPGSAMPPWEHLTAADRWALVYYVRYLSQVEPFKRSGELTNEVLASGIPWELKKKMIDKKIDPQTLVVVSQEPPVTAERLENGRKLFAASCAGCHGIEGKGDGRQEMITNLGYPVKPRDLTAGIFKGSPDSADLYRRMIAGIPGSPMPSYTGIFTDDQIWDMIHFVQSLSNPGMEERVRLKRNRIKAQKIDAEITLNPLDPQWAAVKPVYIAVTPLWWRDDHIQGIEVKALHNKDKIAFDLQWSDSQKDDVVAKVHSFSDGAAMEFSKEKDPPFFGMGAAQQPVYLWHWKAGWENVGENRQDIETEYPNAAVDWYGSQKNYAHGESLDVSSSKAQFHDPRYLTGWGAGNPLSDPTAQRTAEEGMASGLGTLTTQLPKSENVDARGVWENGKWHVIFVRSLTSSDEGGLSFDAGGSASVAFAVWDGIHRDRNGQKMVSIWNELILER